jgi:hypothetical protein
MEEHTNTSKIRFRDILLVAVILFLVSGILSLASKLVWGKQVTWTETLIRIAVTAMIAVAGGYYLLKKDDRRKK